MVRRRKKTELSAFTRNLNALMKERELTIAAAAKIARVPQSTLGDWRTGSQPDDFEAVQRLADHFNVSLGLLLTGKEDVRNAAAVPTVSAVFDDGGLLFDGFAKITIQRLIPREQKKKIETPDE